VIRVILAADLRAMRNRLFRTHPVRLVIVVLAALAAIVFVGGTSFVVGIGAGRLLPSADDALLAGGFTALSALMLVIGFPTVIATFFVGRDLLQLVVAPVPPRVIFAARLLTAMSANLLISAILAAGVLGLGVGSGAPPIYYLAAIPLIAVQVLAVSALQAMLMTVVVRWVPARLARDVAAALAGVSGAGFYLAWNLNLRHAFSAQQRPDVSTINALAHNIDWLPPTWPGHALSAIVGGNAPSALVWTLLTVTLAALLVATAEQLYERTLISGLAIFGSAPGSVRRRKGAQARAAAAGSGSPVTAIARKDWLGFRRDIRRLSRLLPALLFPIGYAIALSQPSRNPNGFWTNVSLLAFMALFMSSSLASPSIPSEKRGFQLLRMAPISMWLVLRAKVVLTLPPVIVMTLLFSVVVAVVSHGSVGQDLELAGLVVWLASGFVAIGVSAGGIDPRFEATDDRRAIGLLGTVLAIGGSLAFGVVSVGAFGCFVYGAQFASGGPGLGPIPSSPETAFVLWAVGVALTVTSVFVVAVLLWVANSRLRAFEATIAATST